MKMTGLLLEYNAGVELRNKFSSETPLSLIKENNSCERD